MITTIKKEDYTVTFQDGPEAHRAVYNMMLAWFLKVEMFNGESLQQSDATYVEAPNILSDLAENAFQFENKWND